MIDLDNELIHPLTFVFLVCDPLLVIVAFMHFMRIITFITQNFKELRYHLQIFSDHGLWTKEH